MDALPVQEQTGLTYASTVRMLDTSGVEKPVMHACGHDVHITALLCAAETLARSRHAWTGTVVLVFQPAEEKGAGARAMVDGGLYERVPVPDVVVGGHVVPLRCGVVGTKGGLIASCADSFRYVWVWVRASEVFMSSLQLPLQLQLQLLLIPFLSFL
jgi:metal-dependent amidase/aminoacylase/carboxypeptidase family protein